MMFTLLLHFATALSTVVVYRKDVKSMALSLFKFKNDESFHISLKIIVSMIPASCIGYFYSDELEKLFDKQILMVGVMLLVSGLLLFIADKFHNNSKEISFVHAFLLGLAQAIALLPGISRSGATICTAVLLGIDRTKAAGFSFLMVIPLILGKVIKDLLDGAILISNEKILTLVVGFITAFLTGIVACRWMISLVQRAQLKYFAYYCFIIGTFAIFADLKS